MIKAYIVRLTDGGNDTTIKLVDQETYDWIMLNDPGKPENNTTTIKKFGIFNSEVENNTWDDRLCPDNIRARICKMNGPSFMKVMLTSGSWDNDRAILAPILEDDYKFECGGSTSELLKLIALAEKSGYEVDTENEYIGYMY